MKTDPEQGVAKQCWSLKSHLSLYSRHVRFVHSRFIGQPVGRMLLILRKAHVSQYSGGTWAKASSATHTPNLKTQQTRRHDTEASP